MKQITLKATLALALCSVIGSCTNNGDEEEIVNNQNTKTITISGVFKSDADSSRLVYNKDDKSFSWQAGDKITIWDEWGFFDFEFILQDGAGTNNGTFVGNIVEGITPKYVTFGVQTIETGTAIVGGTPTIHYNDISSKSGNIMAASELIKSGENSYKFTLQHKLAYLTNTTTTTYSSSIERLTFLGANIAGKIKMDYTGELTITPYPNGKDGQVDMSSFNNDQYVVILPNTTITQITALYKNNGVDPMAWLGSLTTKAGNILHYKGKLLAEHVWLDI